MEKGVDIKTYTTPLYEYGSKYARDKSNKKVLIFDTLDFYDETPAGHEFSLDKTRQKLKGVNRFLLIGCKLEMDTENFSHAMTMLAQWFGYKNFVPAIWTYESMAGRSRCETYYHYCFRISK